MRTAALCSAFTAVIGFLIGLVASSSHPAGPADPLPLRPAARVAAGSTMLAPTPSLPPVGAAVDFAPVAARVNAAVVNIDAAARGEERGRPTPRYRAGDDPWAPGEGDRKSVV